MPEEGVAHRACGVIASGERAHNVHREHIPWTLGLYGACRFQPMAIVAPHLTLWAALSNLDAEAATGFVRIPVAEEFPQGLTTKMRHGM